MRKHRIAAALCLAVAAVVMFIAQSGATAKRVGALRAPVIHENFTLLPCTGKPGHRDTLQLDGCGEHAVLRSDAQIDKLNAKIFEGLSSESEKKDFTAGHDAWLSYRRKYCVSASDAAQGGTLASVIYIDCAATINTVHLKELNSFWKMLHPQA